MERTVSQEERIRRAEEVYYNRQRNLLNTPRTTTVNVNSKKNYKFFKKVIIQICISAGIYAVIYSMMGSNDNFSMDSIKYLKDTIAYDINFEGLIKNVQEYISKIYPKEIEEDSIVVEETLGVSEEEKNIEKQEDTTNEIAEEASSISQMEQDAKYIKENFSLIKPVEGTITSRFGLRNPTTETVPKYHTGIDIAVPEGTIYVASMEGTVELVSSEGDYRKSHKNNKWRSNDFICTLQNNICKRRGQNSARATNRRNWKYRKCNGSSFTF